MSCRLSLWSHDRLLSLHRLSHMSHHHTHVTSSHTGSSACIDCQTGKYSAAVGATAPSTCSGSLCAAGKYGSLGSTSSEAAACTLCPAGKFQATEGSTNCNDCHAGKYQPTTGIEKSVRARERGKGGGGWGRRKERSREVKKESKIER